MQNTRTRVCNHAPFLRPSPHLTKFPPHSCCSNLQAARLTMCCPPCPTYCFRDYYWKCCCNTPKDDWKSPDAYRVHAPAQTAQVGGWFGTNWFTGLFSRWLRPTESAWPCTASFPVWGATCHRNLVYFYTVLPRCWPPCVQCNHFPLGLTPVSVFASSCVSLSCFYLDERESRRRCFLCSTL